MNELLTNFCYDDQLVRTLTIDGDPWFVGKDVANILGYQNHRKALIDHVDEEDKTDGVTIRDSIGREQNPTLINESGLYSLILTSRKPEAKAFKRWVTHEVLPSIRKTGAYAVPNATRELTPDDYIRAADIVANCRRGHLSMALEALEKAGITFETARIEEEEALPVPLNASARLRLERKEAGERLASELERFVSGGGSIRCMADYFSINPTIIYRYRSRKKNPSPDRADMLIDYVHRFFGE